MKTKVPTVFISSGLQAAAMFSSVPTEKGQGLATSKPAKFVEPEVADRDVPPTLDISQEFESQVTELRTINVDREWDIVARRNFDLLAVKEALGSATDGELVELESLSDLRRRSESPQTGDEVMREYEQGQLIRDLLRSLTRYVQFEETRIAGHGSGTPWSGPKKEA